MGTPTESGTRDTSRRYHLVGKPFQNWGALKRRYVVLIILIMAVALGVAVAFLVHHVTAVVLPSSSILIPPDTEEPLPPSNSVEKHFQNGAVCVDSQPCALVGARILEANGSAVDAALAALLCNGLVNAHSMGLGGGFLMTVYSAAEKKAYSLNARVAAPLAARQNMFKASSEAQIGSRAACVPGEILGYWEAHKRFGRLPWKDVVDPAVNICQNGYIMTRNQFDSLQRNRNTKRDSVLRSVFIDPATGNYRKAGSLVKPAPELCNTLYELGERGGEDLYTGALAEALAEDFNETRTILTADDLRAYRVKWDEPISVELRNGHRLYSAPPPGSGALVAFMLKILDGFELDNASVADVPSTVRTYHRVIETYKHAFAMRTRLGDPDFVNVTKDVGLLTSPDYAKQIRGKIKNRPAEHTAYYGARFFTGGDSGTAHVSVIASNGDAVSVTSTLDIYFGSGVTGPRTGILLNSAMDDFSWENFRNYFNLPGSVANTVAPGKRPLSSMSPTIIVDRKGDVRLVIGASGGTKIPTSVTYVILRHLYFGESVKEALDAARIFHQLYPLHVEYEYGVLAGVVKGLQALGHTTVRIKAIGSVVCALAKAHGIIAANADFRKGGDVSGH